MKFTTREITQAAVIAAAYLVIAFLFAPISFGLVQFRISEALMLLSAITPAAIPGLFVGCLLSNIMAGGLGIIDIVLGSLATLLASIATFYMAKKIRGISKLPKSLMLPLPTVLFNAIIVGGYLPLVIPEIRDLNESFVAVLLISMGSVFLGQMVVTYLLGIPFYYGIKKTQIISLI